MYCNHFVKKFSNLSKCFSSASKKSWQLILLVMTWQFFLISTNLPHLPHLRRRKKNDFISLGSCNQLQLLLLLALAAFGHLASGRWHSALINIKSKQVHIGLYRSAVLYLHWHCFDLIFILFLYTYIWYIFYLWATCIFHGTRPSLAFAFCGSVSRMIV